MVNSMTNSMLVKIWSTWSLCFNGRPIRSASNIILITYIMLIICITLLNAKSLCCTSNDVNTHMLVIFNKAQSNWLIFVILIDSKSLGCCKCYLWYAMPIASITFMEYSLSFLAQALPSRLCKCCVSQSHTLSSLSITRRFLSSIWL